MDVKNKDKEKGAHHQKKFIGVNDKGKKVKSILCSLKKQKSIFNTCLTALGAAPQ